MRPVRLAPRCEGEEYIKEERRLHHDDRKDALASTADIDHIDKSFRDYLGKLNLLKGRVVVVVVAVVVVVLTCFECRIFLATKKQTCSLHNVHTLPSLKSLFISTQVSLPEAVTW